MKRSQTFSNGRERDRSARRAAAGDPLAKAKVILRAVESGSLAPEVVAFAALLAGEHPSADERAVVRAAAALPKALEWTGRDEDECGWRGYVLAFYGMVPREPGPHTTFARIQVEDAQDADEGLTPAANRLTREFEREFGRDTLVDTPGWWAIRTGALSGDPHSLKALARLREESPPEYEAVLQGWSRQIDPDPAIPARWRKIEDDLRRNLMSAIRRASQS